MAVSTGLPSSLLEGRDEVIGGQVGAGHEDGPGLLPVRPADEVRRHGVGDVPDEPVQPQARAGDDVPAVLREEVLQPLREPLDVGGGDREGGRAQGVERLEQRLGGGEGRDTGLLGDRPGDPPGPPPAVHEAAGRAGVDHGLRAHGRQGAGRRPDLGVVADPRGHELVHDQGVVRRARHREGRRRGHPPPHLPVEGHVVGIHHAEHALDAGALRDGRLRGGHASMLAPLRPADNGRDRTRRGPGSRPPTSPGPWRPPGQRCSCSAAVGSESLRNFWIRSASSNSPMAAAARPRAASARRKPRLGSWENGTGPWPFHPWPRRASRPRW
ncbi:hypothetical protein H488_0109690 [Kocuria sp. UCD-OTCP]|nr:hypothetical protein H488_0109690 [Kocuria sp. UCD-OTCP]